MCAHACFCCLFCCWRKPRTPCVRPGGNDSTPVKPLLEETYVLASRILFVGSLSGFHPTTHKHIVIKDPLPSGTIPLQGRDHPRPPGERWRGKATCEQMMHTSERAETKTQVYRDRTWTLNLHELCPFTIVPQARCSYCSRACGIMHYHMPGLVSCPALLQGQPA